MELELSNSPSKFQIESSERSNFEQTEQPKGELEKEIPLRGWEADWEARDKSIRELWRSVPEGDPSGFLGTLAKENPHPWEIGMTTLSRGTAKGVVEATPLAAAAKYIFPSEQDKLEQMNEDERAAMIWRDTFGTLLWKGIPMLTKGTGSGAKTLWKWYRKTKMLKIAPIEDAATQIAKKGGIWEGFDYRDKLGKFFKGHGFAKDEVAALVHGGEGKLRDVYLNKAIAKQEMSKGWQKHMNGYVLSDELKAASSYETLQSKHYTSLYKRNLSNLGYKPQNANGLIKAQVEKFYGAELAAKVDVTSLSETEAANLVSNMISPEGMKYMTRLHTLASGRWRLPWIRPERSVWGAGEAIWGAKSNIYDRVVMAKSNVQRYSIDRMQLFAKMLEERGFGKVVADEAKGFRFKPDKKMYNQKTTQAAKEFLERADNMMEVARQKGTKAAYADAQKAVGELMDGAKADSPIVAALIDATYDFQDKLYKEMLIQGLPKIGIRYPLTDKGLAFAQNLSKYWGPKIEQAFATQGSWNAVDKANLVKKVLGEYKKVFSQEGIFNLSKKKGEQALKETLRKLSYGDGFPAYLENYLPRIGKQGARLEANWTQALTGKASFMHERSAELGAERIDDFAELIEARVRAQGKQLYFYDETSKAVEYARRLPGDWKKHTEFLISRALGRPSVVDEKLGRVLNATLPGQWDAYRTAQVAKTLNSMAYSGLLGIRFFSAARNITQPLAVVAADLGGIGNEGHLIKAMAMATTKKTREYLKGIGIISEFVPEQQFGSLMPKFGAWNKYNEVKDAMLWGFKMSDRWNRYVTGAAALSKWERALGKVGTKDVAAFSKKLGLESRNPWIKNEIESLLHLGRFDDAKIAFIKDLVADTQYLYGTLDAPAALGTGGAAKTLTAFQSWWMNYASLITKWAETGTASEKLKQGLSFVLGSAAVEQYLEAVHGRDLAIRTALLGPLPLDKQWMPPVLEPGVKIAQALGNLAQVPFAGYERGDKLDAAIERAFQAGESAFTTFLPGGLQAKQLYRGYSEDQWRGVFDALINYKRREKFEPLWEKFKR